MADKKVERANMTQTDSKGNVTRAPKDNSENDNRNYKWWTMEGESAANGVVHTIMFMRNHQGNRIEQLTVNTRLYGNQTIYSLMGAAFTRAASANTSPMFQRLSYNVCQSVIDTLVSKMAKNKVIPTYITNGGVWDVQEKAQNLTKFTQGLFYEEHVHKKLIDMFRDGAVWGDGFLHIYNNHGKVCIERVVPHEFFVDQVEAIALSGHVKQLHRVKICDREVAKEMFPELEEAIEKVNPADYQEIGGQGTSADLITVIESWHLKSAPDAKDGKHAISIGNDCFMEDYDKEYFPFVHFRYSGNILGWYSRGACERLENLQGEINRGMIVIQRSHWMMAGPKIALEMGSKIPAEHLTNDIASIIHYTQTPPAYLTPPVVQPEVYSWVDSLIEKAYRQEGVSQLSAAAEKPMGVDSGKAMRTMTDIEDDRFLFIGQQLEEAALEVAKQAVNVAKEIYAEKKSYKVIFPDTKFMETIDWKDIQLDEEQYTLKAYPTSSLSDDLTGRLAEIQELAQAGMINPKAARRLMDMPDVEMSDDLSNAAEDYIHKILLKALTDGEYIAPDTTIDLVTAQSLVLQYINYAKTHEAPQDRINLLMQFNAQLKEIAQMMAPPAMPMGAPGAVPPANPTAPPTSNLLPNVNGAQQ